jgi:hypothetical protein
VSNFIVHPALPTGAHALDCGTPLFGRAVNMTPQTWVLVPTLPVKKARGIGIGGGKVIHPAKLKEHVGDLCTCRTIGEKNSIH